MMDQLILDACCGSKIFWFEMMAKASPIEKDSTAYLQGTSGVFVMLGDTALNFQFDDQLTLRLMDESDERSKNLAMLAMLEDAIDEARRVIA